MSKLFQKTLLGEIVLFAAIAATTSWVSGWNLREHLTEEFKSKGTAIVQSIADSSVEILFNRDASTLQSIIDRFLDIQGVEYVYIVDDRDEVIAHTFVPAIPEDVLNSRRDVNDGTEDIVVTEIDIPKMGKFIDISSPILAGVAGYVHVGMNKGIIANHVKEATYHQLSLVSIIFLLSVGIAYLRVSQISKPLNQLTEYAKKLEANDFSATVEIQSKDEVGLLADTLRSMSRQLSNSFNRLEQAVDDATWELQVSNGYLTAILANLADGLLAIDLQGRITQFNPSLATMFELGEVDLKGQDYSKIFPGELVELAAQVRENPAQIFTAEIELPGKRIGKAVATAIFHESTTEENRKQDCRGSAILIRDITSEKEVDRMKTDFLSTVSHELRTPLTSVLGFAKLIKKKLEDVIFPAIATDNRKQQRAVRQVGENINIIVAEGERLTALINDVLDIAKMEAGKIDWKMASLSIEEAIARSLAATSSLFEQKGIKIIKEIPAELPEIIGDKDRLIQVVINLLSNAVKFTDEGAVTCRVKKTAASLVVSVIDRGVGIAPEDQPKVFEKFKQVGDTLTDKPTGTGLGLPICKQIIEHHGGQIWVESELGEGSTFSFSLPLSDRHCAEVQSINLNALLQQLQVPIHPVPYPNESPQKTILVVDDDAHIRELLKQELEAQGYQVQQAQNGLEAVHFVKQTRPDLIIMDVMMPQMNGFDAAAILKNDPATMDIPIAILSIVEDRERGYRLGVDRYLSKPIDLDALLQDTRLLLSQGTSRKKILIVDENASTLKTLAEVLQTRGYSVVEALNGEGLKEKVVTIQPDLIIANAAFWQQSDLVKTVRFEKGMENVLFIVLADEQNNESNSS